ncbi:hypothetical protein DPMN_103541 [Dreissena polymorpha]|uniref:Uncharacterized protein n=1 Tax=Dreissena polymorpha TaxID=45954 RepID=A0A9D4K099_DREPO|nr:hypothetical protein DPMN_103541 [Dreissena polymorpha]
MFKLQAVMVPFPSCLASFCVGISLYFLQIFLYAFTPVLSRALDPPNGAGRRDGEMLSSERHAQALVQTDEFF